MNKIFVSIASYRDSELPDTVESLLSNAKFPENLRVVVFEQNDNADKSIYGKYPIETILVLHTHYTNAKGPIWARYIIQKLYNNEEYYLQIDSHSRFVKNWDYLLIWMLSLVPSPAVLTQYPPEYNINGIYDKNKIRSGLYVQGFSPVDRFFRIQSNYTRDIRNIPYTSKAWSACFSFSKGSIIKDAPYDPSLEFLFFGEEMDITLRLFTRGYYFYSPHKNVIFTLFTRKHRRTYWQDISNNVRMCKEKESIECLKNRMFKKNELYGLGNIRTLGEYCKFADIENLENGKMKKCAKTFNRENKRKLLM